MAPAATARGCSVHVPRLYSVSFFFFNDTATTEIYTLSLHDALPIYRRSLFPTASTRGWRPRATTKRSEEHTSELQSHLNLVCRLLLEKKKTLHLPPSPRKLTSPSTTSLPPHLSP